MWRGRNFRIAWTAGFVNDTGDWVLTVGLPVYVFTETGSGAATSVVFVCQLVVAAVLGPFGGNLVDRWNLRRCLLATNLAQALFLLPLLTVTPSRVWPIYPVVIAQSALAQLNNPANVALLPRLVAPAQLTAANSALSASSSIARLVGAPLGGIAVAAGGLVPVVLIDAMSFVAAAAVITFITADTAPLDATRTEHAPGVRSGLRAIAASPPLPRVLAVHAVSQVAQGAFVVLFVVFVVDEVGGDGGDVGIIRGAMAVGGVVSAFIIGRWARRVPPVRLLGFGFLGMGAVSFVFWNAPQVTTELWPYITLFALSGLPGAALGVGLLTTVQTAAPAGTLGRAVGVMMAVEAVGGAIGAITAGVLADVAPVPVLVNAQAAIYIACGVLVLSLIRPPQRERVA